MAAQLNPAAAAERLEKHFHAFAADIFEGRDEIAVPGNDDDGADQLTESQRTVSVEG